MIRLTPFAALLSLVLSTQPARPAEVASPNGRIVLSFGVADFEGQPACLTYRVAYRGQTVLAESRLGLEVNGRPLGAGVEIVGTQPTEGDGQWKPVYGERSVVADRYRGAVVQLRETAQPGRQFSVAFRVYDAGAAFCYTVPKQEGLEQITVARELTEFRFPADHAAWAVYSAQGRYEQVPLSQVKRGCERPLVLRAADEVYLALAEARLVDYARMKLAPLAGKPNALTADLGSEVQATAPLTTPWRVLMAGASPGELLENNDLLLNLNDPCAIVDAAGQEDTAWIRPGKVIREVTLTTTGGKACVDFAAAHGLQYVEFDAGWYGHEYSDASDATAVNVDPQRSKGPLDLHEVIGYAKERGIGIILYVNRRALERQLDTILPLYREWGVAGVKYGFVNVGSQEWTAWLHHAVRKAAENRLMIDIHDEYRPTGYSRTYPNLMTQEGIAGDETSPTNDQTLTILFTRMLAGAGDNTICYYDPRVDRNASHACQLAKAVCLYSPWQFLYWYDRPPASSPGAAPGPNVIGDEPELEFFARVPTAWDDTRVLAGRIGEYAVIARRSGDAWFIGAMNNAEPRTVELPLDFLSPGRSYTAERYRDDPAVATRTHVRIDREPAGARTVLTIALGPNQGEAIRIHPAGDE